MNHASVFVAGGLALALAACATPRQRVTSAMLDAGLPQPAAECMGTQLADRLTVRQLRTLQRAAPPGGGRLQQMTPQQALGRLLAVEDPEVVSALLRAGASCALMTNSLPLPRRQPGAGPTS